MDILFRPITIWTGKRTDSWRQEKMPGVRSVAAVLDELAKEGRLLYVDRVIVETFHRERDIRKDGLLRADASLPSSVGVVVYVEKSRTETLRFACDQYQSYRDSGGNMHYGWVDNLRAVTLTMESLRGVDRWGVAKNKEQYKGWLQLPTPPPSNPAEDAARVLLKAGGYDLTTANIAAVVTNPVTARTVWAAAVKNTHSDTGGNDRDFMTVQSAWNVIVRGNR